MQPKDTYENNVILETDETTRLSNKTRDAAKQLEKRDTLNDITLGNLFGILNL